MQSEHLSLVVQGAVDRTISPLTGKPVTQSCLENLRKYHPDAEIIFSTWPDEPLDGLHYDVLVVNEDPGAWNAFRRDAPEVKLDNTNRQIVSSRNGLRHATRKYAAKLRSDMIFLGSEWLGFLDRYPARGTEWRIFKERVLTCSYFARDPSDPYTQQPLHPPDWLHLGLREDVELLWNVELEPEPESSQWFLGRHPKLPPPGDWDIRRFSPEQYLWRSLLLKFGRVDFEERGENSRENITLTELSFANNMIILDPDQFPFVVHKYPYPMPRRRRYYRFITHKEWLWLYKEYSEGKPLAAAAGRLMSPFYYGKLAYQASYAPLQLFRMVTRPRYRPFIPYPGEAAGSRPQRESNSAL